MLSEKHCTFSFWRTCTKYFEFDLDVFLFSYDGQIKKILSLV